MERCRFYSTTTRQSSREWPSGKVYDKAEQFSQICYENGAQDSYTFVEIYDEGLYKWIPVYFFFEGRSANHNTDAINYYNPT